MSSSGIDSISSGPLIIRTYNNSGSSDVTYVLRDYDYPVSSNYVLITSTNGQLVPSNNIYVSSITTSSFNSDFIRASTAYLSSVFGFSPVQFYSPIKINNNNPPISDTQLFVNGTTVFSEPGAQSTSQIAGVNVFGLPNGSPISQNFTNSSLYTINQPISKLNFQLIGAGGSNVNGNNTLNFDLPGIGTYISGTLAVKQGDKLQIFTGTVGNASNGSKGTSLIYLSSVGGGIFVSTLVCVAGAGGGNGYAQAISSSSGGGHGGGGSGGVTTSGNVDYYAFGIGGYDGISTLNGNYQTYADGGQGGINNPGPSGGYGGGQQDSKPFAGTNGQFSSITSILTTGGLVNGGAGGTGSTRNGGFGGGGYLGGGGGQGGINVSAGGGGGATYIAVSTLSNYLSNLVCLGGQWISQNNATPFGQDYGLPNNPGYVEINGYQPNDTLYTNGDIECRVLRYEMLDPPINAIGGASALWALYPAIDIVHMNDNQILECGGIEVDIGGIDVANFINIRAGANDSDAPGGFMSKFIRTASSGTQTIDYQVAGDSTEFGDRTWQDARYVYNPANTPNLRQVWGIVTSSNITPVGSTIGDIHFYNNVYVDGNVGIKTVNPGFTMDVLGSVRASTYLSTNDIYNAGNILMNGANGAINGVRNISSMPGGNITFNQPASQNILIKADTQQWFLKSDNTNNYFAVECDATGYVNLTTWNSATSQGVNTIFAVGANAANVGIGTNNPTEKLQVAGTISTNSLVTSSITTNATSLNISSAETSTLGNLTVSGNLSVAGIIEHPDIPPVGAINMYAGSELNDPPGWMVCDGRSLLINTYNSLHTVIGTTYGIGDNPPLTFNIPDMRSRFPVGVGTGYTRGQTGGFVSTTLTVGQIPSHSHVVNDPGHVHKIQYNGTTGGYDCLDDEYNAALNSYFDSESATTGITLQNTGNGDPIDNRPPFFGINYIIKY